MFIISALLATQLAIKPPAKHGATVDSSTITLVEVQNDRHVPVTVYAQNGWGEFRLGVVPADSTETFRVPNPIAFDDEVDFFVHGSGLPDQETGTVEIHRGEHLGILVPPKR